MKVGLLDVISTDGKVMRLTPSFGMDAISFQAGTFPVLAKSPFSLTIENVGAKVLDVSGEGSVTVGIPCDRCLREVKVTLPLSLAYRFDMKLTEEELLKEEDVPCIDGTELDVDALIYAQILMDWPMKVLCREDCKGLCPRCGKNLNEGPCGCEEEPKDPRMAAISDIFKKSLQ